MTIEKWRGEFEGTHQRIIETREIRLGRQGKGPSRLEICILQSPKWVRLAPVERKILERLMQNMGEVVSRKALMDVAGVRSDGALAVNVNRLNLRLIDAQKPIGSLGVIVVPEYSSGYVLYSTDKPDAFSIAQERTFRRREEELFPKKK